MAVINDGFVLYEFENMLSKTSRILLVQSCETVKMKAALNDLMTYYVRRCKVFILL
jgi:hypothetical protein